MNSQHYQLKQPSRITRFLWWCAGADPHFMNDSPMQDRVKYAGIGGIVFATGLMAVFAGYVAFDVAFGPKVMATQVAPGFNWLAGVFSIFWGMVIFNLDRFIVSSTGKGDGTDKITWSELAQAIPRIIIALILGFTISKPLEIKIIESEIDVELGKKQKEKREELDSLTKRKFTAQIALIDADIKKLESDRDKLVSDLKGAEKEYIDQMQGRSGQGVGYGPRSKQLEMLKNEKQKEIDQYDSKNKNTLDRLKADREKKLSEQDHELNVENEKRVVKLDGLLERIHIAHEIGFWLGWALTLIFLAIEMGPIFFKMMMTKGVYDYKVENFNLLRRVEDGIFKEEYVYEGKDGLMHMEKYKHLEVELAVHEKNLKINSQKAINAEIIKKWQEIKLLQAGNDPSVFYTENAHSAKQNNA
jgi:hypothetical protein